MAECLESRALHRAASRLGPADERALQRGLLAVCQQLLAGLRDTAAPLQPTAPQPTAAAAWDGNHLRGGSHHLKGKMAAALDRALRGAQGLLSVPCFVAAA